MGAAADDDEVSFPFGGGNAGLYGLVVPVLIDVGTAGVLGMATTN